MNPNVCSSCGEPSDLPAGEEFYCTECCMVQSIPRSEFLRTRILGDLSELRDCTELTDAEEVLALPLDLQRIVLEQGHYFYDKASGLTWQLLKDGLVAVESGDWDNVRYAGYASTCLEFVRKIVEDRKENIE